MKPRINWSNEGFNPNWHRGFKHVNRRTYVPRIVLPLRLCRHTHWRTTSVAPHYQAFIVKSYKIEDHKWAILERKVWHDNKLLG